MTENPTEPSNETAAPQPEPTQEITPAAEDDVLAKARAESAKYRTRLRNAETERDTAQSRISALEAKLQAHENAEAEKAAAEEFARLRASIIEEYQLSETAAKLLTGDDEESLREYAENIRRLDFGVGPALHPTVTPTGKPVASWSDVLRDARQR